MAVENILLGNELIRSVELLADTLDKKSIHYALIGALAASIRGRPRFTRDVDLLVDVPQLQLPGLLEDLSRAGFDFDTSTVIKEYVQEHVTAMRFGSVRIDWLKPVLPLYARAIATATPQPWTTRHEVRVATAEALILTKMMSFRPQDQVDIEMLLVANRDETDVALIWREWSTVAQGEDQRTAWLTGALERLHKNKKDTSE
jgi:hypothetical protein